jgi:hypothetical protein
MHMIDNSLQKLPKKEKKSSCMVGSSFTFIKVVLIFTKYANRYLPSCHMWHFDKEHQLKSIYWCTLCGVHCVLGVVIFFQFPNVVSLVNIPRGVYH